MACHFLVNSNFIRRSEPWSSKLIHREMKKDYLIRREPWYWLCLPSFSTAISNIAWPWQDNTSSCSCLIFILLSSEQKADGWWKHLTGFCFGSNFSNITSYVISCQKVPFFRETWIADFISRDWLREDQFIFHETLSWPTPLPFTTTTNGSETDFYNTYLDDTIRRELAQCEGRKIDYQATKTEENKSPVKHVGYFCYNT